MMGIIQWKVVRWDPIVVRRGMWVVAAPMLGDCMICMGMCGNGAWIDSAPIHRIVNITQSAPAPVLTAYTVAAVGMTVLKAAARHTVMRTFSRLHT